MEKSIIIAGGGLVTNENGELLMIFRRGKWDLPKGKLDPGENIEACSLREVTEETGVQQLQLDNFLMITKHEYFDTYLQKDVVKHTHWYRMSVPGVPALVPQTEEDITAIEWTKPTDISSHLAESYDNIREVLGKSGLKY